MRDHWTDRLSEYLDGELPAGERGALEAHLAGCGECSAALADLTRVVERAQALVDRPPTSDLWPGIARAIGVTTDDLSAARARRAARRFTFSMPQLIAASVALVLLSAAGMWVALSRGPLASDTGTPRAGAPTEGGMTVATSRSAQIAVERYGPAIAELEEALSAGGGRLDTVTVRVLAENLQRIDRALEDARRALATDPASVYLNDYFERTMRRKLELLRHATLLTRAES